MSRYEVIRSIATGGMAEVLLARSVGEGGFAKEVALKRILGGLGKDSQTVKMLMDEARLAARLTHPNIVQVFDFGRDEEGYFIAMEYVPGPELTRVLGVYEKRGKPPPLAAMLAVMIQVLRGLDYAHRLKDDKGSPMGLVHRDVSPSNILLTGEGVVKVSDFGIAKARGRLSETQVGMVKGKIPYMSPEQTYGKPLDQRSDIFAAGLVLWESLAGRRCYEGDVDLAVMALAAKGDVPRLSTLGLGIPEELSKIVERSTAVDPAARYQTAGEMAQVLESYHRQKHPTFTSESLGALVREVLAEPPPDGDRGQADISTDRKASPPAAPPSPAAEGDWEAPPGVDSSKAPAGPDFSFGRGGAASAAEPPAKAVAEPAPAKPSFKRPRLEAEEKPKSEQPSSGRSPDWKSMVPPTTQQPDMKFPKEGAGAGKGASGGGALGLVGVVVVVALALVIGLLMYDRSHEEKEATLRPANAETTPPPPARPMASAKPSALSPRPSPESRAEARSHPAESNAPNPSGEGGFLDIRCEPWCDIQIDGKGSYRSPAPKIPVSAGTHHLRLSNPEVHLEKKATLVVNPGETVSRYFNLVLGP